MIAIICETKNPPPTQARQKQKHANRWHLVWRWLREISLRVGIAECRRNFNANFAQKRFRLQRHSSSVRLFGRAPKTGDEISIGTRNVLRAQKDFHRSILGDSLQSGLACARCCNLFFGKALRRNKLSKWFKSPAILRPKRNTQKREKSFKTYFYREEKEKRRMSHKNCFHFGAELIIFRSPANNNRALKFTLLTLFLCEFFWLVHHQSWARK